MIEVLATAGRSDTYNKAQSSSGESRTVHYIRVPLIALSWVASEVGEKMAKSNVIDRPSTIGPVVSRQDPS